MSVEALHVFVNKSPLADPRVLQAARFRSAKELADVALANSVYLVDDAAVDAAQVLMDGVGLRADFESRKRAHACDDQLGDSLWVVRRDKARRQAEISTGGEFTLVGRGSVHTQEFHSLRKGFL